MGIVKGFSHFWLVHICLTVISTQLLPSTLYVSACGPAKRLGKRSRVHVVWVCLSDPLDDTLRPRDLFCGVLLHFHHYSDVCKWSSYSTFIVMLSRAPLCQRQRSLAVCLPLLPFRSNLTYCIVYRSVYILKFSLWLPSIVQLHCAGYNCSLSPTFFGRPLQPRGGGRGGGNGVRGPRGFGFLSVRIWVLEPYNYHSLTTPSKAKTDLYLWWSKWMTQRRELAEYSLPATSTIPPLTTSPCSWSELGLYSFPLDLPRMVL